MKTIYHYNNMVVDLLSNQKRVSTTSFSLTIYYIYKVHLMKVQK